jgi:ribonuclease Z
VFLTFLGTSAGTPTRTRNVTSQVLGFDQGDLLVLDAGEGTQHQFMRAGLSAARIGTILITHLHGDHCYGLPGLLALIAIHERRTPLTVIGPRGIAELIGTIARLSDLQLGYRLDIIEHDGDADLAGPHGWTIAARPLVHRVPCSGYVLTEPDRPGIFNPGRARALGVPEGAAWGRLQRGETVDGIRPEQVCAPRRPGRKLVLLGDTSDADAIVAAGRRCDVLVCEATYLADRAAKAATWGHLTADQTGALAARMEARQLIVTHFSSRYTTDPRAGTTPILDQAAAACPGTTVFAADDLVRFAIGVDGTLTDPRTAAGP